MSTRHLPAGQHVAPVPGSAGMPPPVDMNSAPPAAHQGGHHHPVNGGGVGHGPSHRGGRRHQHQHQHHAHAHHHPHAHGGPPGPPLGPPHPSQFAPQYHHQPMNPPHMYGYIPYAPQQQYNPYAMPPQYHHPGTGAGMMPNPAAAPYLPYQYPRSPPNMHQPYTPMSGVTVAPNFPRHSQPSPALSTPYQPPPPLPPPMSAPIPPQTPSSTHSSQILPSHTPPTPQQVNSSAPPPPPPPATTAAISLEPTQTPTTPAAPREPYHPPVPWLSHPDQPWPARKPRIKPRRKPLTSESEALSLPVEQHEGATAVEQTERTAQAAAAAAKTTPIAEAPEPAAQETAQETPKQTVAPTVASEKPTVASIPSSTKPAQPALPLVPVVPKNPKSPTVEKNKEQPAQPVAAPPSESATATNTEAPADQGAQVANPPPKPAAPSSWAKLFAKPAGAAKVGHNGTSIDGASANGDGAAPAAGGAVNGPAAGTAASSLFPKPNANSTAEAVLAYKVNNDKLSFIEPRGLINTGNMCYMNSVGKKAAHSFKSDTPLIDAMIMFMREFKVLKSATSVDQLRRSLKSEDLDKFGEPFTPEFVYDAIRQLPRFASMRRGHQQDAEEFLGFLLQSLDDECTSVVNHSIANEATRAADSDANGQTDASGDWLEVGRKQKAAVTRSSGANGSTPINKVFGGLLRSEFRVPGLKDSITTEPYQPLQLDIGSPEVRSVVDALRGLTRPERLQGDFNSPRGKDVQATKQVFIESLPPVLILHLKRFQFDAEGHGTVKIWKKIDYPLDLEIPREVLSRQKRQALSDSSSPLPRYKLISVVYHHGKNASGGHYTVDVRRQDGQDWLHLDDTNLRRVHSRDVAESSVEEDGHSSASNANGNGTSSTSANRFGAMNDDEAGDEDGWEQVTTSAGGAGHGSNTTSSSKRWSNVVNGAGNNKGKQNKEGFKDSKVAYLLFYQRV
ncbi:ubiquitin carboxyl-terminal hydrolase 10 [Geosmithia morbida]|uniref:ubiquitinyl hydrolase 1 n=1 Tax=Geosmithia morbida TaxID=1094350 RepID=A0A9P4YN10_9HYPO|nr:ubiquitin carboxyl-terminal hydrolase 10 [Geosmithia morbida]KAF4119961.1 ubiquitin carboxyl-terminal hydrolase 10 [Geosmithia morbida]